MRQLVTPATARPSILPRTRRAYPLDGADMAKASRFVTGHTTDQLRASL
jgi:hypothetical protein